jgi:hypothetical protein
MACFIGAIISNQREIDQWREKCGFRNVIKLGFNGLEWADFILWGIECDFSFVWCSF